MLGGLETYQSLGVLCDRVLVGFIIQKIGVPPRKDKCFSNYDWSHQAEVSQIPITKSSMNLYISIRERIFAPLKTDDIPVYYQHLRPICTPNPHN